MDYRMQNKRLEGSTESFRILVTGVSGGSIGAQVCKTLRFGSNNYKIIVTNTAHENMKVVRAEGYELLPQASSANYLDCLLEIIDRYHIQYLIPGSEPELYTISKNRQVFDSRPVRLLLNTHKVISTCVDKKKTSEMLVQNGFAIPQMVEVDSVLKQNMKSLPYPCIVKPSLGGGGSAAVFLAQDEEELLFFVKYLIKYGYDPIIQEYISNDENEYTIGVLHDPNGKLLGSVVLRRQILSGLSNRLIIPNNTGRSDKGKFLAISSGISQGEIVDFEPVRKTAEMIAMAIGSRGPLNIQGRWNGNRFVTFEINPRFSGTTPMRALAGFNEPEILIAAYLGLPQLEKTVKIQKGTCLRGLYEYFIPANEI
jgi:carbamoyl-phosphate synthase large subunit